MVFPDEARTNIMDLEVLISTQLNNTDFLRKHNINANCVVINQCGYDSMNTELNPFGRVSWIDSSTKGLSTSRNLAIRSSSADICLLADDDLIYVDGLSHLIINEFKKKESADLIIFLVDRLKGGNANFWSTSRRLGYLSSMKVSSVQIAFRRKSIISNGIYFNESFGAGAKYYAGEENIWLWACLKKGLKIYYSPVKIATLLDSDSSWFEGYNEKYFISKGAAFAAMSRYYSLILILQFVVRKNNLWRGRVSFANSVLWMLKGRSMFLSDLSSST
jgi:glycosyltransferase involved in cell wall biosynthesis